MAYTDSTRSSLASSDHEGDTFEDATDMKRSESHQSTSSASIRSLTGRPPSTTSTETPRATRTSHSIGKPPSDSGSTLQSDTAGREQHNKSPLLTSHPMSSSSLDEIQLSEVNETQSIRSRSNTATSHQRNASRAESGPKLPFRSQGLLGPLPTVPWGPPPQPKQTSLAPAPASASTAAPHTPSRSFTSPFSWLTRNASVPKDAAPHVQQPVDSISNRRNTASSINTLSSNPELMMSKFDDRRGSNGGSPTTSRPARNSLRDRFKILRMREEAGITSFEGQGEISPVAGGALAALIGRGSNVGMGIGSPTSVADEKEGGLAGTPVKSPESIVSPAQSIGPIIDPNLAPGTAAGVSTGVSSINGPATPVDWDLWQAVVYEGPSAVARTSAEELNRAIASGIPSAIRGVVWQVLAQSKNEDLEGVYRDLVARGTDKDQDLGISLGQSLSNGATKEKNSIESSSSSIHSNQSTAATSATNGVSSSSPPHEKDAESIAKLQAAAILARKQKAKEDAAGLQKLEKAIKRDLGARTSYSKYAVAAGLQDGLFGVCKAYALFDEAVGYAQGMNFLVMPLLFNMPEEEAFCLLVRLMNQYHLRDMFIRDMPGLHLHLYQFERLLEDFEPALYCHLHRRNVSPQLYATQWFLTLFAYRFPLQLVLRIYDLILSEGLEGAILKFGIVLMQKNAQTLLTMNDMTSLTNFLKDKLFDVYIDQAPSSNSILESGFFGSSAGIEKEVYRADILVQDACAVKITPEMLNNYRLEWEEKLRTEKEREAELEALRTANASLILKVRSLEERTEKSDLEHVQMASEVVRTKVENDELHDKIESLKGQVAEYKTMVEVQPKEVEERLKKEMDRIMTRNIEVQNENRALEEQMADMEKDLVETKMGYAEIYGEHETLKQKWGDLRKAVGA